MKSLLLVMSVLASILLVGCSDYEKFHTPNPPSETPSTEKRYQIGDVIASKGKIEYRLAGSLAEAVVLSRSENPSNGYGTASNVFLPWNAEDVELKDVNVKIEVVEIHTTKGQSVLKVTHQ